MWTLDVGYDPPLWRPDPAPSGCRMAFSTRQGGVSDPPYHFLNLGRSTADRPEAVDENRRRFLEALALDPGRLATAGQVHGVEVARVVAPGLHPERDALVTSVPDLPLAVTGADCLPILYVSPGAVAAAHAGWRGTVAGIAEKTLAAVCEAAGVDSTRVQIHFGPCIRVCCYEVGPEVAARFPASVLRRTGDSVHLSVPDAVRLRLAEAGVPPSSIHDTEACTACEPHWYYSHRRDHGLTGRHWGLIALTSLPD